ncbi:c-type cytochrome [Parahaliea aestuarii]|uniref:Cytochrome c n=1 Tax=Parahaliea aestuarii TaxID=1852021 RepID=A0A5C8ZTL2_9GAMM|nr:cytochrome c [Parahaliea aestuarii]TXS90902.1 cytochrome c [Parahaliea aestuarii]
MRKLLRHSLIAAIGLSATIAAPLAISHFDDKEPMQSSRQSYFALVAASFGPIGAMVKGDMPWDEAALKSYAGDLENLTELNALRFFAAGSEKGTTRAKPEIWSNMQDFSDKYAALQQAAEQLEEVVDDSAGDRKAVAQAFGEVGQTCKACHDDYKAKNYLY